IRPARLADLARAAGLAAELYRCVRGEDPRHHRAGIRSAAATRAGGRHAPAARGQLRVTRWDQGGDAGRAGAAAVPLAPLVGPPAGAVATTRTSGDHAPDRRGRTATATYRSRAGRWRLRVPSGSLPGAADEAAGRAALVPAPQTPRALNGAPQAPRAPALGPRKLGARAPVPVPWMPRARPARRSTWSARRLRRRRTARRSTRCSSPHHGCARRAGRPGRPTGWWPDAQNTTAGRPGRPRTRPRTRPRRP